ncbi:SET methyltransferase domain containing protein [Nitzschia inconspicua]|uniref:SET methyltransferase domain containing protein n=1 Tax=Nitzschia inconspicua TaxID=303405 RepID=A0A9K3KCV2_9STRA|nr:SET methyltransferase domain containing protein [Nitzschia inconspicua]
MNNTSWTINPPVRQIPWIVTLTVALVHLYFNGVLLREAADTGNNDSAAAAATIIAADTKTPFLRNMNKTTTTATTTTNNDAASQNNRTSNNVASNNNTKKNNVASQNHSTNNNAASKPFGEKKQSKVRAQYGINSTHMAMDGAWVVGVSKMLGCPDVDEEGIISDDPNAYNYIPNNETWNALYRAYHATVDPNNEFLTATEYQNSWKVPIEVKFQRPEGRGVYAKEFIPKGTLVWSSTSRNTATFLTSHDHREFIEYLIKDPKTRHLACDVQMWIDVMSSGKGGTNYICETFDEAVLLNTAWDDNDSHLINIEPQLMNISDDDPDYDENDCYGNDHYFTVRDIQAGEQFRIDYGMGWDDDKERWEALGLNFPTRNKVVVTDDDAVGDDAVDDDE